MDDVLTDEELVQLTKKKRPSAQARVLCHLGIEARPRPDGTLVVSRARRDEVLGVRSPARRVSNEINWA
jgi:hypothetical protein